MAMGSALYALEEHLLEKRILIVDDEADLADMVAGILHAAGFAHASVAHSGEEALILMQNAPGAKQAPFGTRAPFDLFVLDVMMPGIDGFQLLARLRALPATAEVPALFLTAKDEPFDRVNGLSLGADDYLVKPFLPQELVLRIAAILRRCYANESPKLQLAFCTVDFGTAGVARADGTTAELTAKEHEILSALARNIGRIVTIDALCEACWGTTFGYENSLMAHIRRLREKIEENPSKPQSLVTVKGLGYKLVVRR
ncbi:MAG: response regulator transcription factor [Eggerthellaceae bacterium]|nr:response regulator transcription factor [Eggerthellaceae bacterium]